MIQMHTHIKDEVHIDTQVFFIRDFSFYSPVEVSLFIRTHVACHFYRILFAQLLRDIKGEQDKDETSGSGYKKNLNRSRMQRGK